MSFCFVACGPSNALWETAQDQTDMKNSTKRALGSFFKLNRSYGIAKYKKPKTMQGMAQAFTHFDIKHDCKRMYHCCNFDDVLLQLIL